MSETAQSCLSDHELNTIDNIGKLSLEPPLLDQQDLYPDRFPLFLLILVAQEMTQEEMMSKAIKFDELQEKW